MNKLRETLSLFRAYVEFNFKRAILRHKPLITGIEITNACNYKCNFCPMNSTDPETIKRQVFRKKNMMDPADFEEIITRYRSHIGLLDISHHGESFVHPKFPKFIGILKKHKVRYRITTNGSLVHLRMKNLIDYPPEVIYFSLYSLDPKNYHIVTGNGSLEQALKNLEEFIKLNRKHKLGTEIHVRTIDYPLISKDIKPIEKFFEKYPEVTIDRSVLNSWGGRVDIKKYDTDYEKHARPDKYCIQPWQHMIVCSDGGAYVCNNHEDVPVGYVLKEDIIDIWNSNYMRGIRRNILKGSTKKNDICKECDYYNLSAVTDSPSPLFFTKRTFLRKVLIHFKLIPMGDLTKINVEDKERERKKTLK